MSLHRPAFIAAALLASALGASAQEATSDAWMSAASTKTRAEVQAEWAAAKAAGGIRFWSAGYIEPLRAASPSREAVREATRAAIARGEVAAINAAVPALPQPALVASPSYLASR